MRNGQFKTLGRMGANLLEDPTNIADEEFVDGTNLWPEANGNLAKRPSMQFSETLWGPLYFDVADDPESTLPYNTRTARYRAVSIEGFIFSSCPGVLVCWVSADEKGLRTLWARDSSSGVLTFQDIPGAGRVQLFNFLDCTYCLAGPTTLIVRPKGSSYEIAQWVIVDCLGGPITTSSRMNGSIRPAFMDALGDRLVLANLGGEYVNSVVFGDPFLFGASVSVDPRYSFPPDLLATNGLRYDIGSSDEGPITGLVVGANAPEDYPKQKAVYVFKETSMWTLLGEAPNSLDSPDSGDMQAIRSNLGAGCASHRTIVRTPFGLIWAGVDDVWMMPFGNEPYRIGTKIKPILEAQPPTQRHRWHASYFDGAYRLALFTPEQGAGDLDACGQQWWLDLRMGAPSNFKEARWYGPQKFVPSNGHPGTFAMAVSPVNHKGFVMDCPSILVGTDQYVQVMTLGVLDGQTPRDTIFTQVGPRDWQLGTAYSVGDIVAPAYDHMALPAALPLAYICETAGTSGATPPAWGTGGLLVDNTVVWNPRFSALWDETFNYEPQFKQANNEVLFNFRSKEVTAPGIEYEKLITSMYMTFWADRWLDLDYSFGMDLENNTKLLEAPADLYRTDEGFELDDVDKKIARRWQARQLPPSPGVRSRSHSLQLWMNDNAKIYLPADRVTLAFIEMSGGVGYSRTFTFNYYEYSTIWDLLAEFVRCVDDFMGPGVFTSPTTVNDAFMAFNHASTHDIGFPFTNDAFSGTINGRFATFSANTLSADILNANRLVMGLLGFSDNMRGRAFTDAGTVRAEASYTTSLVTKLVMKDLTVRYRTFKRNPL